MKSNLAQEIFNGQSAQARLETAMFDVDDTLEFESIYFDEVDLSVEIIGDCELSLGLKEVLRNNGFEICYIGDEVYDL